MEIIISLLYNIFIKEHIQSNVVVLVLGVLSFLFLICLVGIVMDKRRKKR